MVQDFGDHIRGLDVKVACLCPTYLRPVCTANVANMFRFQTYPERRLYILDDGGTFDESINDKCDDIRIRVTTERFPTLPDKYNALLDWAIEDYQPDIIMVWENDDLYLPDHISRYVEHFRVPGIVSVRLSTVFVYHPVAKRVIVHRVGRNFHGCLAFRPFVNGTAIRWHSTPRAWYDVEFMDMLTSKYPSAMIRGLPTYVYRNPCTETMNASHFAAGPLDDTWYQRYGINYNRNCCGDHQSIPLEPKFDEETKYFLDKFWMTGLLHQIYIHFARTGTNLMGPSWLP